MCEPVGKGGFRELHDHPGPHGFLDGRDQHALLKGCRFAKHVQLEAGTRHGRGFENGGRWRR